MGYMGQAHDGYVDLYNDLGYVGLGMLMAVIVTYFCLLWRLKVLANPEFYFHFCLMLYILISNITESSLLRGMSFMNLLFYASYIRVSSLAARPGRLADPAGRPR
jgi:O-antigen ligase